MKELGPVKKTVITFLLALHLFSVAIFIWTDFPGNSNDFLSGALRTYRNLSGTFRDYRFFAPAVASDTKAGFLLEDASGRATFNNFTADNREVALRYNNIIASAMRDERGRDLFAQSWAAFILGSHEDAVKVTVVARIMVVPTMEQYREGVRPEWETIYLGLFAPQEHYEEQ